MNLRRSVSLCVLGIVLGGSVVAAQDFDRYREFQLGSTVADVSALTGAAGSELKAVHERPAVIQQLTWRPRYGARRPGVPDTQSVDQVVFDFYDGHLFRVTVDYDRKQTEGLVDADMIDAITAVYGPPVKVTPTRRAQAAVAGEDGATPIAQWGDAVNSVRLHRLPWYAATFRLTITAEPVATLARTAVARAMVLDAREAPQREAAREKKEADDRRAADEKARLANRPAFQP